MGLRLQKKFASKFSTRTVAKTLIDDQMSHLLDTVHIILSEEFGSTKADKIVKNMIKITVKIGILYKNDQFNDEELRLGLQLRKKLRATALTIISFHDVDFSYDSSFLIKLVEEISKLLHDLVQRHLTPKSHTRIEMVIDAFKDKDLLDKVFLPDQVYHSHLAEISKAFESVVDSEW